ncbi:hypothetical protein WJX84_003617 [Apatococcus fuscideae]|uniref:Uncharacterized protein n=1 Tax=Apatococcus fuscideae TaxID=2026836 RepID=A0AAW1T777_9CHLO
MAQPGGGGGASVDHGREPCPDRILDDIGGAFGMGAVGGGVWNLVKGLRNAPRGSRMLGGVEAIRREAPRIGGSFAVWGGLFSTFDCTLVAIRKKEDPWNSISAGALTGGFLQLRTGLRSAAKSAAFGGVLLGMIEGLGILLTRMSAPPPAPPMIEMPPGGPPPTSGSQIPLGGSGSGSIPIPASLGGLEGLPSSDASSTSSPSSDGGASSGGWFSGLFGGGSSSQAPPQQPTDLTEDKFGPPPTPPDFQQDSNFR